MRALLPIAAALALGGCATGPAWLADAAPAIVRLQRAHRAAYAIAALFRPYLTPAQAARIDALDLLVDRTLAAARTATDRAARRAALADATAATTAYRLATGG